MSKKVVAVLCMAFTAVILYVVFVLGPINNEPFCNLFGQEVDCINDYLRGIVADVHKSSKMVSQWPKRQPIAYGLDENWQCYDDLARAVNSFQYVQDSLGTLRKDFVTAATLRRRGYSKNMSSVGELSKMAMMSFRLRSALSCVLRTVRANGELLERAEASCPWLVENFRDEGSHVAATGQHRALVSTGGSTSANGGKKTQLAKSEL